MAPSISVVINTLNDEARIGRALKSVSWADEIVVCDMHSDDKTVEIAKSMGAKIVSHKRLEYVEPARNFAISKASGDWILILDPDEEITQNLKTRLIQISGHLKQIDYVRVPRQNIIFGKWMKASMWWPDLNIRFFKKGALNWSDKIHRPPQVRGEGLDLEAKEEWAIIHHNYQTISQFVERLNRYTTIEARELKADGYRFNWKDLVKKPTDEFLSRFFANNGFKDGLHGLALSLLQALSFFIVYLKVWENENFEKEDINIDELKLLKEESGRQINWWFNNISGKGLRGFLKVLKGKF